MFTISKLKATIPIIKDDKVSHLPGYAFLDRFGRCIIQVYGDKQKELMNKYLKDG